MMSKSSKEYRIPSPTYMDQEQMCQSPMSPYTYSTAPQLVLPHTPPRASKLRECMTIDEPDPNTTTADLPISPTAAYLKQLRKDRPSRPSGSRPPPPSKFGSLRKADTSIAAVASTDSNPSTSITQHDSRPLLPTSSSAPVLSAQKLQHRRTDSNLSSSSKGTIRSPFVGRPLARAPAASPEPSHNAPRDPLPRRQPSVSYMENGMRWMEKQEVKSIRQAMEDMDLVEEKKIHSAAQEEAAELVWKHQNPEVASGPFANPDLKTRDYRSHLRQGSYHRTHSQGSHHRTQSHHAVSSDSQRSTSGSSQGSDKLTFSQRIVQVPRKVSPPTNKVSVQKRRSPSGKSYDQLAEAVDADIKVAHRRISSGSGKRIISGEKKKFMSPDDRIWEDPDEEKSPPKKKEPVIEEEKPQTRPAASQALPSYVRKNPFARVRVQYEKNLERSNSAPQLQTLPGATLPRHDRIEIQRNPPSQSRNPLYTSNDLVLPPTPPVETGVEADEVAPKTTPSKDGKELRGDDIRAATSKSRTAYSPNLPRPTMVSEKPGRPIVSFQKDYKPKEMVMQEQHSAPSFKDRPLPDPLQIGSPSGSPHRLPCEPRGNIPGSSPASRIPKINLEDVPKWAPSQSTPTSARGPPPPIPTILAPDDPPIPSIALPEEPTLGSATPADPIPSINADTPSINVSDSSSPSSSPTKSRIPQRPLPAPSPGLPLPRHASTTPASPSKSTPHYTPSVRQSGTLCAHCALPIAGRILSAAGERLHPGCFTCHECNTNLELVAFYPEPEQQRAARIERIRARQSGHQVTIPEGITEEAFHHLEHTDGDGTLRFYCHLDFHELFSPRCKSCKTPIEGEVIVACGAEWHVGHFFCAQCGDPFDSSMPFVEKDGYAWCVNCHTNRYSSKCRKCRKPVTDVVVKALGSDWHSECFRCLECNGEFEDGRYFLRGNSQDPVCVKCEERRLKA